MSCSGPCTCANNPDCFAATDAGSLFDSPDNPDPSSSSLAAISVFSPAGTPWLHNIPDFCFWDWQGQVSCNAHNESLMMTWFPPWKPVESSAAKFKEKDERRTNFLDKIGRKKGRK